MSDMRGKQLKILIRSFCHRSGSVCLDVINQTWSPMYDMLNIFEVFLPQLLRYPNPSDPLNGEAAALMMREPKAYEAKVKGGLKYKALGLLFAILTAHQNMLPNTPAKRPWMKQARTPSLEMSSARRGVTSLMANSLRVQWTMSDGPQCERFPQV